MFLISLSPRFESLIFPRGTGHRVKDHIMIQNEVLNEKTTQKI
jgi:hypothetical protein